MGRAERVELLARGLRCGSSGRVQLGAGSREE
jgi:hypothetical protein